MKEGTGRVVGRSYGFLGLRSLGMDREVGKPQENE